MCWRRLQLVASCGLADGAEDVVHLSGALRLKDMAEVGRLFGVSDEVGEAGGIVLQLSVLRDTVHWVHEDAVAVFAGNAPQLFGLDLEGDLSDGNSELALAGTLRTSNGLPSDVFGYPFQHR